MNVSAKFSARCTALFQSQRNRGKEKKDKNDRIIKAGYELPFTNRQFMAWMLDKFGGAEAGVIRCRYCNKPVDAYSCVVDHEVPLKRGGSPGLSNLGLPCEACNQIKGGMTPDEFQFFLDKMAEMSVRFYGGQAVSDITSRLQKAIKLAAAMRFNIATRQRKAVATVMAQEDAEF